MKIDKHFLLGAFALSLGFTACSDNTDVAEPSQANTYLQLAIKLPNVLGTKASSGDKLPDDYNFVENYEGNDAVKTLDVFIQTGDGEITPYSYSFEANTLGYDEKNKVYYPLNGIKTKPGNAKAYVVINKKNNLTTDEIKGTDGLIDITKLNAAVEDGKDVITMTGASEITEIKEGVTEDMVKAKGAKINQIKVTVDRTVSRVIVTKAEALTTPETLNGSFSNITYAIAQGTKKIYTYPKKPDYTSFGYDFVPASNDVYVSQANGYYDYADLSDFDTDVDAYKAEYKTLPGKFLYENTHEYGEGEASKYKKGNTAYVLIRTKFKPNTNALNGGELATDGTFYVGGNDGLYYATAQAAADAGNTSIRTYKEGKVLFYAWLNPDDIAAPYNSPVVRNNIYHINITGFKKLGTNWNPLFPEDPTKPNDPSNPNGPGNNPDPKPEAPIVDDPTDPSKKITLPEPENPVKPTDPLTVTDTWLSVDVTVGAWAVHSYDIDLSY